MTMLWEFQMLSPDDVDPVERDGLEGVQVCSDLFVALFAVTETITITDRSNLSVDSTTSDHGRCIQIFKFEAVRDGALTLQSLLLALDLAILDSQGRCFSGAWRFDGLVGRSGEK